MVKTLLVISLSFTLLIAKTPTTPLLQTNCMNCHVQQKVPSELIYRRYLSKYSTHVTIKKALLIYLKTPKKENSIMPKQFFLKFPKKEAMDLNNTELNKSIDAYLDYFDVKKKLVLP